VRRRSMTNGNGAPQTPASGLPLNGGGSAPNGGPPTVGQGPGGHERPGGQGQPGLPVPVTPGNRGGRAASEAAPRPAVRQGSRLALRNWRVRWRLIAIIVVPTVTALIFGAIQIASSVNNYTSFKRVQTLANLNALVVKAAGQVADERDLVAGYVAAGKPAAMKSSVTQAEQATDATFNQIRAQATAVGAGYRAQTVLDLQNGVLAGISDLPEIRDAALTTRYQPLAIIESYDSRMVTAFDTFSNDIAAGTGNDTLQTDVSELNALLRMEDDASLQRAYLYQALINPQPTLTSVALSDLNQAQAQQQADLSQFSAIASVAESQTFNNTVSGQQVDEAESEESLAISLTNRGQRLSIGTQQTCTNTHQGPAACWLSTQSNQINLMRQVSNGLVGQITAQANSLVSTSLRSAAIVSVVTLVLLLLVLLITTIVARSMIRPLRKLRADALEVAGSKLPDTVRRLSQSEGGDESIEIEPIGVTSTDEIGEVARAFDQVHREAVRLAADEAMLRGNLNAMFVNLSRRSQSLIERQLGLIDNLEQTEQDPDRLSSLFRLDHLATRMRRNSENLLVLAGHEASRRWSQPVPLVDVLRAAISEIEQYERVVLNVQPGIQVTGQAVNDVVHLVAEIVENATTFSPEDTQVYVTGQPLTSGGVLLDITDNGVGISEQEMAHANWRLDNPPVVDVAVSRRMGLFVVGRLAARHGIRVRLRHAQSGGLTALIWLPESVAVPESAQPLGRLRKFEADDFGPAPSLSAPPQPSVGAPGAGGFSLPAAAPGSGAAQQAAAAARIPRFSGGDFGSQDSPSPGSSLPARQPGAREPGSNPQQSSTEFAPRMSGGASGAETNGAIGTNGTSAIGGSDSSQVTIPPTASPARDQRLPIFDSLESDWFRRSGKSLSSTSGSGSTASGGGQGWNSPADEGWRAAKVVASPAAGEITMAGLPKRVPRANLVPGSVGGGEDIEAALPARSADTIRSRMASFQRGVREARAAAPQIEEP
jgi:signal transduction histidine kinase